MIPAVIGVTGLPCSGKSLAAELMASGAVPGLPAGELFKADDDGHIVLTRPDMAAKLRERFGDAAFDTANQADIRRAIAERVFSNPDELAWLESQVHPLVVADTDAVIAREKGKRPVIVEAALLFAANMDARCDRVLMIESDISIRWTRAAKRGWSRDELQRREKRQVPLFLAAKERDSADRIAIVENNGTVDDLIEALGCALGLRQ